MTGGCSWHPHSPGAWLRGYGELLGAGDRSGEISGATALRMESQCHPMRTIPEENRKIGEMIACAANESVGPVVLLIPLKGVSQLNSPGGPFWDPAANGACFDAIKTNLKPGIRLIEMDHNINDPEFAEKSVELLLEML